MTPLNDVFLIGGDQALEHRDLVANGLTTFRLSDVSRLRKLLDLLHRGNDVSALGQGLLDRLKVMVFSEVCALGIKDQRIATVAIGFGEGAINRDRLARVFKGLSKIKTSQLLW